MPDYVVRVIYEYPVSAISAEDALSTVPIATRLKYLNAEGITEILNAEGKVVLTAKLVTKPREKGEQWPKKRSATSAG